MDADEGVTRGEGRGQPGEAAGEGGVRGTPDAAAVGCADDEDAVAAADDEVEMVDETVVPVAQEDETGQIGRRHCRTVRSTWKAVSSRATSSRDASLSGSAMRVRARTFE